MRTVLVLAAFVALAAATFPSTVVKTKPVDKTTVERQYKILELFEAIKQVNPNSEYYKVGKSYDIRANIENYENKQAVDVFFQYYDNGYYRHEFTFTIFNEEMRKEAKYLYDLFYSAKDFDTFYKTAAWARYHLNKNLFAYTFYIAVIQRQDTTGLVLPAFYEIWPQFFANFEVFSKMYFTKQRGLPFEQLPEYGIIEDGNEYLFYSNYSDYRTYGKDEYKLAYLTEDVGWNTYYNYFHSISPFWQKGDNIVFGLFKERRGEIYYYFYQQLLARYYLERLTNGLGRIPTFSWYQPFKTGYYPAMTYLYYPFVQRSQEYIMQTKKNLDDLRFVRLYEDLFTNWLQEGKFKTYNQQIDFYNSKSINFVGNFWQANPDLYEKLPETKYYRSYEQAARRILGGSTWSYETNVFKPSALDFYLTSLRDPAFYQIYNKIFSFMYKYKQYVPAYTQDSLHYVGVKVKNVEVSKLSTFFDFWKFNASNAIYYSDSELTTTKKPFMIAQPRLNHESFDLKITVKSDVDEEATVKVFLGPKYDEMGYPVKLEDNWQNFVELDWFRYKLTKGETVIERKSDDFFLFKEDSSSIKQIYEYLAKGELPVDMMEKFDNLPRRLMLPKGTKAGFPLQFFVFVYKSDPLPKEFEPFKEYMVDEKPFGYPLDRPVPWYFMQPNMYFKDVKVYHKNEEYPWFINPVDYKH